MISFKNLVGTRFVSSGKYPSEPEGKYLGTIVYDYDWSTDEGHWLDDASKKKAYDYFGINDEDTFYDNTILYNEETGVFSYMENMSDDEFLIESSYLKGIRLKSILENSGFSKDNFIYENGEMFYGDMAVHAKHKSYALDQWISSSICEEENYNFRN